MSSVKYTRAFTQNVGGRLKARFLLDADGEPIHEEDEDGLKHYQINLSLESPKAPEIDIVKYFMDDETYWDPLAVSKDPDNDFTEEISSYGDLEVEVTVQIGKHAYKQRAWLSNLLEAGSADDVSPAALSAIGDIKKNQYVLVRGRHGRVLKSGRDRGPNLSPTARPAPARTNTSMGPGLGRLPCVPASPGLPARLRPSSTPSRPSRSGRSASVRP